MKCRVKDCSCERDWDWGALGFHLRSVHGFGDHQMHEYFVKNFRDFREGLKKDAPMTETLNLRVVFLPDEATREGLIHVLSEVSGAIIEMEEIKNE